MAESMPPTLAQLQQLNRSLTEKVLDKAASDPAWKQQLLDDPEAAMRQANFPETQQVAEMRQSVGTPQEVTGQHHKWGHEHGGGGGNCSWDCILWSLNWYYYSW